MFTYSPPEIFIPGGITMDRKRGLYDKFRVERTDGRSEPGEKHDVCQYFVLDVDHDPHARAALLAYAESCREDGYEPLADDLVALADLGRGDQGDL